jgi:hypothetical protein
MIALLWLLLAVLASPFKPKCRLETENAALRHQVMVLRRQARSRIQLTNFDRLFLVQLYHWFPSILRVRPIDVHDAAEIERAVAAFARTQLQSPPP